MIYIMYKRNQIYRGEIYYAELKGEGSQQDSIRPVIIYSNNKNNLFSPTVQVIPLTTKMKELCVHVLIEGCGLREPSMALLEQLTVINKTQIREKIGMITDEYMDKINLAADIQFARTEVS